MLDWDRAWSILTCPEACDGNCYKVKPAVSVADGSSKVSRMTKRVTGMSLNFTDVFP